MAVLIPYLPYILGAVALVIIIGLALKSGSTNMLKIHQVGHDD